MNLEALTRRLVSAEMGYAHFNARRTSAAADDSRIRRGATDAFEFLLDPDRPASIYYNRAVGRSPDAVSRATLGALPDGIVGLETTPAQLNPQASALLAESAFRPASQLCYLGLVPGDRVEVTRAVRQLDASDVDRFFDLLQWEGMEFPAENRTCKRAFYCTEQFRTYVVHDAAGAACGWTTMYVQDRVAFFGNSFTLPQSRRAGAHGALLAARLNAAAELNLEAAFTDVEFGSQSHANCERAGFRTLTINTIWSRA